MGAQFEKSSLICCRLESLTLSTKNEAEYISDGVTRARGRLLSSVLRIYSQRFPVSRGYIESVNRDASGELHRSKDRCGIQVPYDVPNDHQGLERTSTILKKTIEDNTSYLFSNGNRPNSCSPCRRPRQLSCRGTCPRESGGKGHEYLRTRGWDGSDHRSEHPRLTGHHKLPGVGRPGTHSTLPVMRVFLNPSSRFLKS